MNDTLDVSVIEMLKELGGVDDPGLFGELVDAFVQDTPPRLDAIERALRAADHDALAHAAHPLKSSAANMGAMRLSAIAGRIEAAGRDGTIAGLPDLAAQARVEYEAARQALCAQR